MNRPENENLASQSFHLDNLQEGVIALGMYQNKDNNTVDYSIDQNGTKKLSKLEDMNTGMLAEKFKNDPKDTLAFGRRNLFAIMEDPNLSKEKKRDRVERYLDAFLNVQLKLDHIAFPPDETIRSGVPEYLPDGLTDMGSDPDPDPQNRLREKIRIDKAKIFEQAKQLFTDIFSTEYLPETTDTQLKKYIVKRVAHFVYTTMPYDHKKASPFPNMSRSVRVSEAADQKLAVCRHHAIYSQVLLQAFGLTSRLLKCDLDSGKGAREPHACNLVRVDGKWAILDSTNPDEDNGVGEVFIAPIQDQNIDLNNQSYAWPAKRKKEGKTITYYSRNKMYYKQTDTKAT